MKAVLLFNCKLKRFQMIQISFCAITLFLEENRNVSIISEIN